MGIVGQRMLGIEHEGYVNNASWYTTAMYNASAALTRHFCSRWGINCATAYNGSAHSGVVVLSSSIKVKGHQHFPNNTHTDPGINWDWRRYYGLLEKQFRTYYEKASRSSGITGENLLRMLETRLDNVVYRLGFAASRAQALVRSISSSSMRVRTRSTAAK